jgi:hypothetical protein
MCKIEIYSDDKFITLQKRVILDLKLTQDNVKLKILELPILFTKYKKLYLEQREILKNINIDIKKTRAKKYHHYKFDGDFRLDTATEINIYVDGDNEMCHLNVLLDKQEGIVEFLNDTISQISKMSYLIRSYVDLEKLRNGDIS